MQRDNSAPSRKPFTAAMIFAAVDVLADVLADVFGRHGEPTNDSEHGALVAELTALSPTIMEVLARLKINRPELGPVPLPWFFGSEMASIAIDRALAEAGVEAGDFCLYCRGAAFKARLRSAGSIAVVSSFAVN